MTNGFSQDRSVGSVHPRYRTAPRRTEPPAGRSARPVRGVGANSALAFEIGDGDPSRCDPRVQPGATDAGGRYLLVDSNGSRSLAPRSTRLDQTSGDIEQYVQGRSVFGVNRTGMAIRVRGGACPVGTGSLPSHAPSRRRPGRSPARQACPNSHRQRARPHPPRRSSSSPRRRAST